MFLSAMLSLALAGCGGGGGGSISTPGGAGAIQGAVDTRQVAQVPGGASLQSFNVTVEGTTLSSPVAANGSFQIPSLPAGHYVIAVKNGGGPSGHPTIAGYASVQVTSGKVTSALVTVLPAGFIAGVVSQADASGNRQPVGGVTVTLTAASQDVPPIPIYLPGPLPAPAQGSAAGAIVDPAPPGPPGGQTPLTLTTTSAADGSFTFAGVPPGLYQVTAASGSASASDFVDVTPASAALANLYLQAAPVDTKVEVHGVVLGRGADGSTHPLDGATVQMEYSFVCGGVAGGVGGSGSSGGGSVGSGSVGSGSAGSGGSGIAVRSRQVVSVPPCVGPPTEPPIAAGPATGASGSSTGVIAGPPPPGIVPIGVRTDAHGNYSLIVPSSVGGIIASDDGYIPETQRLNPQPSNSQEMDFTLDPDPGPASLKASLSVDGQPGASATVTQGQPFKATLSVTNTGSQPAVLDLFGSGVDLRMVDASGNLVWSLYFGMMMPDLDVQKVLQPGETYTTGELVPGLTNSGVPLPVGAYSLSGEIGQAPTNPVAIAVTASNGPPPPPPPV